MYMMNIVGKGERYSSRGGIPCQSSIKRLSIADDLYFDKH